MNNPRQPRYGDIFAGCDEGAAMAEFARVKWAEYRADLESRNLFNRARSETLDRLVRALTEYHFLYPMAVSEGPVRLSDGGNEYVNMKWSMVQKLSDQIGKLERALMLTPESIGDKAAPKASPTAPSGADKYLARQAKSH